MVDDNDDAAELLAVALQQAGYETTTAHDGGEAIEAASAVKPHVVILDIGLPDMNGYQVAEQLRRDPCLEDTALIALTGGAHQRIVTARSPPGSTCT